MPPPPNEIFIPINGINIRFIKAPFQGKRSQSYIDTEYKYFYKIPKKYKCGIAERKALEMLQKYPKYFPRIIGYHNELVILEYINNSEQLQTIKHCIPEIAIQVDEILNILQYEKITHNDIHKDNLLVDASNNLYLIDFGECIFYIDSHINIDKKNMHKHIIKHIKVK